MEKKRFDCRCPHCHNQIQLDMDNMTMIHNDSRVEEIMALCPICGKTIVGDFSFTIGVPKDQIAQFVSIA